MERQTPNLHKGKTKNLSKKLFFKIISNCERERNKYLLLSRAETAAKRGATLMPARSKPKKMERNWWSQNMALKWSSHVLERVAGAVVESL